jgi:hypothetical protein
LGKNITLTHAPLADHELPENATIKSPAFTETVCVVSLPVQVPLPTVASSVVAE